MAGDLMTQARARIDQLDRQILDLLNRRAAVALDIGEFKKNNGLPVMDPSREREHLSVLAQDNQGPLPDTSIKRIFSEIISACRQLQACTRVSFLGPEATFSHLAALEHFGRSAEFHPCDSVRDVFWEVENGRVDFGVVPVENSSEGTVGATLDQFLDSDLKVCGEIFLRVSHALLSKESDLDRIKRVLSHPQALSQCFNWLSKNLPGRETTATSSTAAAALTALEEPGSAAIGSELLAEVHGLNVLARDIQGRAGNQTRFLVLGRLACPRTGQDKTSIWFMVPHRPGALHHSLQPLADHQINLTRIESRPAKNEPWEYVFFVDFEGHLEDPIVQTALDRLAKDVVRLTVLGSYPLGGSTPLDTSQVVRSWNLSL